MKQPGIDARLASLAELVRQDAVFADIGTDHAYLPLFLLSEGKIARAVCSDLNALPLEKARENAERAGFSDRISFHLCDGAAELSGLGLTDVAIAGMGGELIAAIIDRAPFLQSGEIRLILQPMSRARELREYLSGRGFEIEREVYSESAGKCYVAMQCRYTGEVYELSPLQLELGDSLREYHLSAAAKKYADRRIFALRRRADGKIKGGDARPYECEILELLEEAGVL